MFSPDASFTFQDLILRVAENVGLPYYPDADDNRAQIPQDPHNLDLIKRSINDGTEMVMRAYPHWTWLQVPFTLGLYSDGDGPYNIDGDAGRYLLPWFVSGNPTDSWVFSSSDSGVWGTVVPTSRERIAQMRSTNNQSSGIPQYACVTPVLNPGAIGHQRQSMQVIFWPNPGQRYDVSASFRFFPRPMVELTERHPAGAIHQQTFVTAGTLAFWSRPSSDEAQAGYWQQKFDRAVSESIALDQQNVPKNLGQVTDPSAYMDSGVYRPSNPTMYLNGVAIPTA